MINNQNKSKFFLVIIAILFIANIAMLAFFLQKKETGSRGSRPERRAIMTNFLQKEIGFDQAQLLKYDSLSSLQRERFSSFFETMRKNKNENYKKLVAGNFSDSVINLVADQSAATQKMMEVQMSNHIKKVRQLCTPEQLPRFDSMYVNVFNRKHEGRKKETK